MKMALTNSAELLEAASVQGAGAADWRRVRQRAGNERL